MADSAPTPLSELGPALPAPRKTPLLPRELAAIGEAQRYRNAPKNVYDPVTDTLVSVPAEDEKLYADAGYATGENAEIERRVRGVEGQAATALLGIARGTSASLSDLLVPRANLATQRQVEAAHKVTKIASEIGSSLASFGLAGGGAAALASREFAALAAAGGRVAYGAAESGIRAAADARKLNEPITMEHFGQAVGLGALLSVAGEGIGHAGGALVTAAQKRTTRFLTKLAESDAFKKTVIQGAEKVAALDPLAKNASLRMAQAQDAVHADSVFPALGEARPLTQFDAEPLLPSMEQTGIGGGSELASPTRSLASAPFAQAELIPEPANLEAWGAARREAQGANEATLQRVGKRERDLASRLADEPLSAEESTQAWHDLDAQTLEEARMRPLDSELDVTSDLRNARDRFSADRGMSAEELDAFRQRRAAFLKDDPELSDAFARAGFDAPVEADALRELPPLPQSGEGGLTELPIEGAGLGAGEAVGSDASATSNIPASADFRGLRAQARKSDPFFLNGKAGADKRGMLEKFPRLPSESALAKSAGRASELPFEAPARFRYESTDTLAGALLGSTTQTSALATASGLFRKKYAAAIVAGRASLYLAKKATASILNHQQAISSIVDNVVQPTAAMTGKVVRTLLQGSAPNISSSYLSGDTDTDYKTIANGVNKLASDPTSIERYYSPRYGGMFKEHPEFYGGIVTNQARKIAYLDSKLPRDERTPGLIDEDYDPPRSLKLKFIQAYQGANDPFGSLMDPSVEAVSAVNALYPETMTVVRRLLADQLADPKVAKKLTGEQSRQISIIMGIPVRWVDSPDYVAGIQSSLQRQAQAASQAQQNSPAQAQINGIRAAQSAKIVAPPSQQNELDNVGG